MIKSNLNDVNFEKINFSSKNNFSFKINDNLKLLDTILESEIIINETKFKIPDLFNNYLTKVENYIYLKDHKIKAIYKKDSLTLSGLGKIKLENKFDNISYTLTNNDKNFLLVSSLELSELRLKNKEFLKFFFPKLNEVIELKNQKIEINYDKNDLSIQGAGNIRFEKEFDEVYFDLKKKDNKIYFNTQIDLGKTSLNVNSLNFKKNNKLKTQLKIIGNYQIDKEFYFKEISILEKNSKIILENFFLDNDNKIIKIDKVDLDYLDTENKKNQFTILRKTTNDYVINGSIFNANILIDDLLKSKKNKDFKIFKNDINLKLNLNEVFISDKDIVSQLKGSLNIKSNKVTNADISAFFKDDQNLSFTINTNNNGEKITTLFSSRAKPIIKKYNFIKGYEGGYLDFYSSKKNDISNSKIKIYNFNLQKLPVLTKLLTLASLQGIADILSGEGISFDEFEMNFINEDDLMTIDEIYAIGPAISILMSGYVQDKKLISLRGTLVPATTINKTIASIPILGKILVGNQTGEGVFGVSFKIKGPPNNLETTVNPIKTLTPRFITRTLEKIRKKN